MRNRSAPMSLQVNEMAPGRAERTPGTSGMPRYRPRYPWLVYGNQATCRSNPTPRGPDDPLEAENSNMPLGNEPVEVAAATVTTSVPPGLVTSEPSQSALRWSCHPKKQSSWVRILGLAPNLLAAMRPVWDAVNPGSGLRIIGQEMSPLP